MILTRMIVVMIMSMVVAVRITRLVVVEVGVMTLMMMMMMLMVMSIGVHLINDPTCPFCPQDKHGRHTVHFPTPYSVQLRTESAWRYQAGLSIWELGQGLESFMDIL